MEWVWAVLPGVVLIGVVGALVVRSQRRTQALIEAVEARGWRYVKESRGFSIEGGEVLPWTLTVKRSGSSSNSNSSTWTVWEAPVEPTEAVVLAGPKLPSVLAGIDLGGGLVQMMLRAVLGDDAASLANVEMVEHGEGAFAQGFSVVTDDRGLADAVLDARAQQLLLDGPDKVTLLRWRDRLQVRLPYGVRDPEGIAALVALGEELTAE